MNFDSFFLIELKRVQKYFNRLYAIMQSEICNLILYV